MTVRKRRDSLNEEEKKCVVEERVKTELGKAEGSETDMRNEKKKRPKCV